MDLQALNFKDAEAQTMELLHPVTEVVLVDNEDKPMTITLYGADSEKFTAAMRAFGNKKLKKRKSTSTMEEIEETSSKLLANITVDWNLFFDGNHLECNQKTAEWLYTEYAWIREQVDNFVNERSNFLTSA